MRLTYIIPRILTILVIILLVIISTLIVMGGIKTYSKQINVPTAPLEAGFVLDIPQKALLKNYVVVAAQTTPGTNCELVFIPPSGEIQKMDAVADDHGRCIWRWKLDESFGKGYGRLILTIGEKSETHFFEIRSSF